jgi:hypothetical protein
MTDSFWLMPFGLPLCWKEDYRAFCAIFEDAHNLPGTWEEFMELAEAAEEHYQDQGHTVVRVYIDPRTFPEWCARNGHRVNARARNVYAANIAQANRSAGG